MSGQSHFVFLCRLVLHSVNAEQKQSAAPTCSVSNFLGFLLRETSKLIMAIKQILNEEITFNWKYRKVLLTFFPPFSLQRCLPAVQQYSISLVILCCPIFSVMLDIIGLYLVRGGCKIKFGLNMAAILLGHQGWFTNWQGTFFICVISNLAKLNQPAKSMFL